MKRVVLSLVLLVTMIGGTAMAGDLSERWGLGFQAGLQKLMGGDHDYSNVDQNVGLWIRHGLSPRWSLDVALKYGYVRPGALAGEDAGFTFDTVHAFYTTTLHGMVGARYHFAPESRLSPYLGIHAGYLDWRVRDENGNADVAMFPDGPVVDGYDSAGRMHPLSGQNLTGSLGFGLEYFLGEGTSFELGTRYTYIIDNDLDNIGTGNIFGPEQVDANDALWEGFLGLTFYFGGDKDKDKDGIINEYDTCPEEPEDFDGFQDADGCPEADNDGDGLIDADDNCPDDAEDRDGFRDEDGCPDPDNDGDGVIDANDQCPDESEDMDGFQDDDGCPDPDNDGDGVADGDDRCANTPAGVEVDATGCPVVAEIKPAMLLKGVTFRTGSAELESGSVAVLNEVAASLKAWPEATIEIQGHTDSSGSAETNRNLSMRRAEAVRQFFIGVGVDPGRMTAVGYGEDLPIADNSTREGRATNRRVELVRTDK